MPGTRYFYLWLLPTLLIFCSACSSNAHLQKYHYLVKDIPSSPTKPTPVRPAAPSAAAPTPILVVKPSTVPTTPSKKPRKRPTKAKTTEQLAVQEAMTYLGTPYLYGGMSKKGMDCSALMYLSYKSAGLSIPRTSAAQSQKGKQVDVEDVKVGNLVFFDAKNRKGGSINHVGMVVRVSKGKTEFIHASVSRGVTIDKLEDPYWESRLRKAVSL